MSKGIWLAVILVATYLCIAPISAADIFSDVKNAVGDVARASVKVATAPTEAVVGAARAATGNGSADQIFQPYRELGQAAGNAIDSSAQLVNNPRREIYQRVQEAASSIGGPAEFLFDVGTFQQRYLDELAASGAHGGAQILRQQNPLEVTAAPLAAAIVAARERHITNARPLPDDVRQGLAPFFPPETLDRARYAIGKVEITLPNLIGQGSRVFQGEHYAVVVDDVIVFNAEPPSFQEGKWWWGHEVAHVDQYRTLGVDRFAFEYLRDLGNGIEADANGRGTQASGQQLPAQLTAESGASFGLRMTPQTDVAQLPGEHFVARCFFPMDPFPVHYLVTSQNRIFAWDPMSGQSVQVGWAMAPLLPDVAWTYETPRFRYAVMPRGEIIMPNFQGQWVQIGHVQRL